MPGNGFYAEGVYQPFSQETWDDLATADSAGYTGPTIGEMLAIKGHKLRRADKNRMAGKVQIHEYLRPNRETGRPRLQITSNCINLIKELQSLPLASSNPEDVDTKAEDHAYDALRYMLMTRMTGYVSIHKTLGGIKNQVYQMQDQTFGY